MTIPLKWRGATKERFLDDPISYLAELYADLAEEILAPNWRLSGTTAVPGGAVAVVVAVEIDRLPAQVFVTPNWNTTTWVDTVTTAGFTAHFGTAAPGPGGTIFWWVLVVEPGPA